jgi:hypothetical protein
MNAALLIVCLAGTAAVGQSEDTVVLASRSPRIEVKKDRRQTGEYVYLMHNGTYMGRNYPKPTKEGEADWSRFPTTYFHDKSPIGMVMKRYDWFPGEPNTFAADARLPASLIGMGMDPWGKLACLWSEPPVGVLGLDVGTIAAYARPTQMVHITERIPAIVKLSLPDPKGQRHFHYLQDALERGACVKVFDGEPRETIEKHGGEQFYQVLVVETYKLPVNTLHKELITKEGMASLVGKLREDGILCYHTSNRYYDLDPVVASVAKELKLACVVADDGSDIYKDGRRDDRFSSSWVMVAREWTHLAHLQAPEEYAKSPERYWLPPKRSAKKFIWADQGENSLRGLYRSDPDFDRWNSAVWDAQSFLVDRVGMNPSTAYRLGDPIRAVLRDWNARSVAELNGDPLPKKIREKKK